MEPVAVGILLRSALVGGEIDGHLTEFTKVAQRQFREKGGESDVRTLAEFIPCHGGSPRSVLVGGGGFFFDRRHRFIDESHNRRFVAVGEAARTILVVDSGACAGVFDGITACEAGNGGGKADGVAVVRRSATRSIIVAARGEHNGCGNRQ